MNKCASILRLFFLLGLIASPLIFSSVILNLYGHVIPRTLEHQPDVIIIAGHWIRCRLEEQFYHPAHLVNPLFYTHLSEGIVVEHGVENHICALGYPFQQRVRSAVHIHNSLEHSDKVPMIFTGGKGEAKLAALFAHQKMKFSDSLSWLEVDSKTTMENAMYGKALIKDKMGSNGPWKILVVSDAFHVLRCKILFEKEFGKGNVEVAASSADIVNNIWGSMREVGGFVKNWWQGYFTWGDVVQELLSVLS
eukprot:TRINITY_DN8806_c0_g1_i1.p1 TRINITY_DN8806_c0_g1~~TRINITY_DN8806_c0_g1_i1.p1  ORF type:complete len:250 (-),score=48.11 TRINITY_DN8806_c0_g1_i1:21-770(-)